MEEKYENFEAALNKAGAYLGIKPRTEYQVRVYLKSKGYEDVIDEVIDQLKEYKYIDDYEFACMYFRYGFEKGRGVARIKRELREKGVDRDTVDFAYEDMEAEEEVPVQSEAAMSIAMQIVEGIDISEMDYAQKCKLKAKVGRRLASRGYATEDIYKVINRLF